MFKTQQAGKWRCQLAAAGLVLAQRGELRLVSGFPATLAGVTQPVKKLSGQQLAQAWLLAA
ncbi:hypothetical protein BH18ACI2_BH18ACI2_04650 [soil metagenome]